MKGVRFALRFVTYTTWRTWLHVFGGLLPGQLYFRGSMVLRRLVYWARDLNGGKH